MQASRRFLTDEQWTVLASLLPSPKRYADGRDRPIGHDDRAVMEARCGFCTPVWHGLTPTLPATPVQQLLSYYFPSVAGKNRAFKNCCRFLVLGISSSNQDRSPHNVAAYP